jgi:glucosamine--fructose-6-phosphate aminotransferase (isomerizing)
MDPMEPSIMVKQVEDLPVVIREQTRPFDSIIRNILTPLEFLSLRRVFVVGDGDSYHASMASEFAFENIARIPCEPMSAQRFLDYGAEWMPAANPNSTLVVGISASGKTQRVIQSLERAKKYGALTLALTGTKGSPLTGAADRAIQVQLPDKGPSPGIRTYSASLMALALLAIRIGEVKDRYHQEEANAMRQELTDLAGIVEATAQAGDAPARRAADALHDAGIMIWVGSGPSYGTALFSAAKTVEAASVFSVGQDLEEWWHVEKFAFPNDMPTFIVAPPGRSHWRAVELAKTARQLGRRIGAVVQSDDREIAPFADFVFPVMGPVREEFSPLVYHIASDLFAAYLTEKLGRKLFQTDNPAFRAAMAAAVQPQPAPQTA